MPPTTVLVTAAGTATALNVLRALHQQGEIPLRLVGTDMLAANMVASSPLCGAFRQLPASSDPDYLPRLLDICVQEQVDIVIPINDGEVEAVAVAREELARQGIKTLLASLEVVATCNDKRATYDLLCRHDVPTPATWLPEELERAGSPKSWPLVVKPRRGIGAVDVYIANDEMELAVFLRRVPDAIVQEYLPGEEYTVDVLADNNSRILAAVPRLRLQTKAGVSSKGRTVDDAEMIERTARFCAAIGLRGPANVQWRRTNSYMGCFEINPRFSGALALTIAAGANTPLLLVKLLLGQKVEPVEFRAGVTMLRSWSEQFLFD